VDESNLSSLTSQARPSPVEHNKATSSMTIPKILTTNGSIHTQDSSTASTIPALVTSETRESTSAVISTVEAVAASSIVVIPTNTAALPSTSSIASLHSNHGFLKNGGAIAGLAVSLGLIVIGLAVCILLRRRNKRPNYRLEKAAGESDYLRASAVWGRNSIIESARVRESYRYSREDLGTRSDVNLRAGYSTEKVTTTDNDSRWSYHSYASSQGTLGQPAMSVGGSQEYVSSLYPASLLPAYAGRSFSPPSYTDLSHMQTLGSQDDMAVGDSYQGRTNVAAVRRV
jgi:hypothetical protein